MKIIYWITTVLVCLALGFGGFQDLTHSKDVMDGMAHLGYPPYVATILGVFKLLGTIVLLAPFFKRAKEWAYAGAAIDFIGAAASHASVGDTAQYVATPLVLLVLLCISYYTRLRINGESFSL
ncbi:MAG: DoxX family protein [Cytophagales bacterium]|jgi:uncharacterized membrane protein YphA (DoxX/SURF4 family)|nr:DoxX family protein [Cytophagales bacterium]